METPLTILYTYGLRGDLDVLPRLYSFIKQLRATYTEQPIQICLDDPAPPIGRILLVDLGENCAADVWHCEASGGRSMLVALDGMGYDAARVDDAAGKRAKLGDGVRMALVDGANPALIEDVAITAGGAPGGVETRRDHLQISLAPAEETRLDGARLALQRVESGQIGAARLAQIIGRWTLTEHEIHDLPRRALPDPTIAASVEFVINEARYAQKRRASS